MELLLRTLRPSCSSLSLILDIGVLAAPVVQKCKLKCHRPRLAMKTGSEWVGQPPAAGGFFLGMSCTLRLAWRRKSVR